MSYDDRLSHMLAIAEQRFGRRTQLLTLAPVCFHNGAPHLFYPRDPSLHEVTAQLNVVCERNYLLGCYQLAHEAVHLLSPIVTNFYTVTALEEGLAMCFAFDYCREFLRADLRTCNDPPYDAARALVEQLLTLHPDAILRLREQQPVISRITADAIQQRYGDMPATTCEQLAAKFNRVVPAGPPRADAFESKSRRCCC